MEISPAGNDAIRGALWGLSACLVAEISAPWFSPFVRLPAFGWPPHGRY